MTSITGSPCLDPTCYRGGVGEWNYQYKDGPCAAVDCQWPRHLPARPHFTDNLGASIVDEGWVALVEKYLAEGRLQVDEAWIHQVEQLIRRPLRRPQPKPQRDFLTS